VFRWWRRPDAYLIEVVGGILILLAANLLFWPSDPGFRTTTPHPLLALVAIVAARYGLREALMAALVSAASVLAWTIVEADRVTIGLFRGREVWTTPLMLVATGFVLGSLGEQRRRRAVLLQERMASLERELADQAVQFMASAEAKHELELRVSEEQGSLSNLYAAARLMDAVEPERLYPVIVATMRRFLEADACQLYLAEGGILRLRAVEGPPPARTELPVDEGLAGLALRRSAPVSIRDLVRVGTLEDLQHAPLLLAAPITDGEGTLLGCLTVTRLPFLRLTPTALDRLRVMADWAGRSIMNARRHARVLASTITDDLFRTYTYAYFQRRLGEEQERAVRYDRPLSVLIVRIAGLELVPLERRPELGRLLARVFSRIVRTTDLVCRYATDDAFAIILPETPPARGEALGERLAEEVHNFHFRPYADEHRELEVSTRLLPLTEFAASGPRPA